MADSSSKTDKAAEKAARERFAAAMQQIEEGAFRFGSKLRGQAGISLDDLMDPEGDSVRAMADVEGDAGALALSLPLELITFETWLLGQVGDEDELDLDIGSHREHWFNFGCCIGEALRKRHGGHWLIAGDDPKTWRMGFSKILLETAPFMFAEALLRVGASAGKQFVREIERLRELHVAQADKDGGKATDKFSPQHYIRLHTIPLGQWMVMDLRLMTRLWAQAAAKDLVKQVRVNGKRLGPQNEPVVQQILDALGKLDQDKPAGAQVQDRGLFEAISQIVALRRTSAPLAMDVLEQFVMPAVHMGVPDRFPPVDDEDLEHLRKGWELFAVFIDMVPFKHQANDEGFLGVVPHDELGTPYADRKNLEVGKGDWVVLNPKRFSQILLDFDAKKLLAKFDDFAAYMRQHPGAPRRPDNGRFLAETVVNGVQDFRNCVVAAGKEGMALLFRMLPPPG